MGTNVIIASLKKQLAERDARIAELEQQDRARVNVIDLLDRTLTEAQAERDQAVTAGERMIDACRAAAELTGYFDGCCWSPEVKLEAGVYPPGTTLIPVREDTYLELGAAVGSLMELLDPDGSARREAEERAQARHAKAAEAERGRKAGRR